MTLRVVVAEDQALVRAGLVTILRTDPGIEVVGEAADGQAATRLAEAQRPDVALLDVRMPILDGLAATRQIIDRVRSTRVVVLTTFGQDEVVFEALRSRASGFLLKDPTGGPARHRARRRGRGGAARPGCDVVCGGALPGPRTTPGQRPSPCGPHCAGA